MFLCCLFLSRWLVMWLNLVIVFVVEFGCCL